MQERPCVRESGPLSHLSQAKEARVAMKSSETGLERNRCDWRCERVREMQIGFSRTQPLSHSNLIGSDRLHE